MREPRYIDLNEALIVISRAIDGERNRVDWDPSIDNGLSQAMDLLLTIPVVAISELQGED